MKNLYCILLLVLPVISFAGEDMIGYLGVNAEDLSSAMKVALGVDNGVLIESVADMSPAHDGGLKAGDVIIEVDGVKIADNKGLKEIVSARTNEKVKVKIYRDRAHATKTIKLGAREKSSFNIKFDVPPLPDLKDILSRGTEEIKKEVESLKKEIELIKRDLEELKKK